MAFKANTSISGPPDSSRFSSLNDMNGYGWHPDHGLFIPVSEPLDYIPEPYPSGISEEEQSSTIKSPSVVAFHTQSTPVAAKYIEIPTREPKQPPRIPFAPSGVIATPGIESATVSWNALIDGVSLITSCTVTPYIGSVAQSPTVMTPPGVSIVITGLSVGVAYTFVVTSTNDMGTSAPSSPSNVVTPSAL